MRTSLALDRCSSSTNKRSVVCNAELFEDVEQASQIGARVLRAIAVSHFKPRVK